MIITHVCHMPTTCTPAGVTSEVRSSMEESLVKTLTPKRRVDILRDVMQCREEQLPYVITFCGVNGVGKSTNLAKVCVCVRVCVCACVQLFVRVCVCVHTSFCVSLHTVCICMHLCVMRVVHESCSYICIC